MIKKHLPAVGLVLAFIAALCQQAFCGNIDPDDDGHRYAWSESSGWVDFKPSQGSGVTVSDISLTGFAWSESVGWVRLDPQNCGGCGVTNDGIGLLSGWGWSETAGWISFSCENTATCGTVNYQVSIEPGSRLFTGYAWSESLGWIKFNHSRQAASGVKTAWQASGPVDQCPDDPLKTAPGACGCGVPDTDSDGDGTPDCNDGCPNDPLKTSPGACGCGVLDSTTDSDGDSVPDCIEAGAPDTDMDNNGTPDSNQGNIASFPDGNHNSYITMMVDDACSPIRLVTSQASTDQDPGFIYPCGLINFELACESATIRLIFHDVASLDGFLYRKFGSEAPDFNGLPHWYTLPGVTAGTVQMNGRVTAYIEFSLTNGSATSSGIIFLKSDIETFAALDKSRNA